MQFPRWLKLTYWGLLFIASTWVLAYRYAEGDAKFPNQVDVAVAVVWVVMAFVPLFSEFSIGALSVKQEVQTLKAEVKEQLHTLRADFAMITQVQSQLHQQVSVQLPAPPPDSQLPAIEERIRQVIREEVGSRSVAAPAAKVEAVPENVLQLFAVRYALERQLRRLAQGFSVGDRRPLPIWNIARNLARSEVISHQMADSIREVYSVCSPAVHGEVPTSEQTAFVRDVGPQLVAALKALDSGGPIAVSPISESDAG